MRRGLLLAAAILACGDDGTTATGADESGSAGSTSTTTADTETSMSGATSTPDTDTTTDPSTGSTTAIGSEGTSLDGTSSGSDGGSSSSGGTETSCEPPSVDGSAIGQDCMRAPCPAGYECIDHVGVQLQQLCGIPCEDDCMCPDGFACTEFMDKAGTHYECA